jgi:hypothetical protein
LSLARARFRSVPYCLYATQPSRGGPIPAPNLLLLGCYTPAQRTVSCDGWTWFPVSIALMLAFAGAKNHITGTRSQDRDRLSLLSVRLAEATVAHSAFLWRSDGTIPVVLVGGDGRVHPLFCRAGRDCYQSLWLHLNPPPRPHRSQSSLTFQADLAAQKLRPLVGERAGRRRARGEIASALARRAKPRGSRPTQPSRGGPIPAPNFSIAAYGSRLARHCRLRRSHGKEFEPNANGKNASGNPIRPCRFILRYHHAK